MELGKRTGNDTFGYWKASERMRMLFDVKRWTINLRSVVILLGVLSVIVLVLVLPQVDLLDTAFHRGTAPIVVHSQGTAKPAFRVVSALSAFMLLTIGVTDQQWIHRWIPIVTHQTQVLNHTFRC
jgi:hypothetical protein